MRIGVQTCADIILPVPTGPSKQIVGIPRSQIMFRYLAFILPAVLVVFLFCYLPIYGVLIAFQDFMPGDKILSDTTIWVGFENFTRFFNDVQFWPLMKNTFLLCIFGFIMTIPFRHQRGMKPAWCHRSSVYCQRGGRCIAHEMLRALRQAEQCADAGDFCAECLHRRIVFSQQAKILQIVYNGYFFH